MKRGFFFLFVFCLLESTEAFLKVGKLGGEGVGGLGGEEVVCM